MDLTRHGSGSDSLRADARLAFILRSVRWRRVASCSWIFGLSFAAVFLSVYLTGRLTHQAALTSWFALLVALPAAVGICRWVLTRFVWPLVLGVGATFVVTMFLAAGAAN